MRGPCLARIPSRGGAGPRHPGSEKITPHTAPSRGSAIAASKPAAPVPTGAIFEATGGLFAATGAPFVATGGLFVTIGATLAAIGAMVVGTGIAHEAAGATVGRFRGQWREGERCIMGHHGTHPTELLTEDGPPQCAELLIRYRPILVGGVVLDAPRSD